MHPAESNHPKPASVLGLLLISQIALRAVLFRFQYQGVNYFGGDSGVYYMTAENLEMKNHFWPIGWPLLLKFFLLLGHSPSILLAIQALFGLLSQIIFIRILIDHGRVRLGTAALLSVPFFCNPAWIRLNSLILMADTLVAFFVLVSIDLGLRYIRNPREVRYGHLFLFSLFLGCGTFFKLVLRVVSLPIAGALLTKLIASDQSKVGARHKWLSAGRLILQNPSVALRAARRNLGYYLTGSHQDSLSYSEPTSWPMATVPIQELFQMDFEKFKGEAEAFAETHRTSLQVVDRISTALSLPVRYMGLLWLCAIVPLAILVGGPRGNALRASFPVVGSLSSMARPLPLPGTLSRALSSCSIFCCT